MQSSDEDALSGIGAGAGQSKLLSHKSSVNLITKITIILGCALMLNSFILTSIFAHKYNKGNKAIVKDYCEQTVEKTENKNESKDEKKVEEKATTEDKKVEENKK